MRDRGVIVVAMLCSWGCDRGVEVDVSWNEKPARVDKVTVAGVVALEGEAATDALFPLHFSVPREDSLFGVSVRASYRGLEIAIGYEKPIDGVARVGLVSETGLDALRPCDEDADCATGTCGPKLTFSESLWSCVTECSGSQPCPGGASCDASAGVCVPSCMVETDCIPSGPGDSSTISPWSCRLDAGGKGICSLKG